MSKVFTSPLLCWAIIAVLIAVVVGQEVRHQNSAYWIEQELSGWIKIAKQTQRECEELHNKSR
jgi:hypothetical protein